MVTRQLWKGLSITAKRRPIFTLKSSRLYGLGVQGQGHGLADVNNFSELMRVNDVVSEAVKLQEPVVALESTIITHGMPYPENFRTAIEVENIIRDNNAVSATIGIIEGKLHIGLTNEELRFLSEQKNVVKTSRRDMAFVLSKGLSGGTTVSGTMIAAHTAGIPVFVTGGIGGVHRGASETFDVSADLTELSKTPVAVICAGVKSILDIGLTLEFLETQGVTVVSYGKDRQFPAFFTPKSGFEAPYHLQTAEEVAELIDTNMSLNLSSGIIVGVPIPEEHHVTGEEVENAIQVALGEADKSGVKGKEVTPFVLRRVNELTGGKSLEANIALVKNNAKVGAEVAVHLAKLKRAKVKETVNSKRAFKLSSFKPQVTADTKSTNKSSSASAQPVVIGGSNFDIQAITDTYDVLHEATNKGKLYQTLGGVGRNIAECLARLETNPLFISSIGEDTQGSMIMDHFNNLGMDTRGVLVTSDKPTASYSVMMNCSGEVIMGVGDMDMHDLITPGYVEGFEEDIKSAPIVCIDGNISRDTIKRTLRLCQKHKTPDSIGTNWERFQRLSCSPCHGVINMPIKSLAKNYSQNFTVRLRTTIWFEPTDMHKGGKPFTTNYWHNITYASPNKNELYSIFSAAKRSQEPGFETDDTDSQSEEHVIQECIRMSKDILQKVQCLVITLGKHGVLICRNSPTSDPLPVRGSKVTTSGLVSAVHYPAVDEDVLPADKIKSVSGAGDSLAGAMIACLLRGDDQDTCVKAGLYASFLSLQTQATVSEKITPDTFSAENVRLWASWQPRKISVES